MSVASHQNAANKAKHGREIFVSRMLSAIAWSILLQCLYVSCVLFLMNTDILHPVQWVKNSYSSISHFGTWVYLIPLGVMTFAQGVLMSKDIMFEDPCIRTRFGILCSVMQPRNIVMVFLNMIFGAMIVSYYSALLGDDTSILTKTCTKMHEKCLHEGNLYLIASGVWIGLYSSLKRLFWDVRVLLFPLIQQLKYPQVKARLSQLVVQSCKDAALPYLYFCFLYWWFGGYFREHLSGLLGVSIDEESIIAVLIWKKPFLMMRCLVFSAIVILTGRTLEMLFQVFLTEHCRFPISDSLDGHLTLNEVLASPMPLVRRLGYLDLLHIAERDPVRQSELFSLSLPGGHPHNWNGMVSEVLRAMETLTTDLGTAVSEINRASNGPLLPSSPNHNSKQQELHPTVGFPMVLSQTSPNQLRMRNMSIIPAQDMNNSIVGSPLASPSSHWRSRQTKEPDLLVTAKQQLISCLQWVRRKPGINLLFGEMEDAHARHLLLHSQHLSWGIQALAQLSAASLKRDTYGVVQKDLPFIIKSLIQLKNVLDRLPLHYQKRAMRSGALDLRMKSALVSSVKRSLYMLCTAFGPFLSDIPLTEDLKQVLRNYVNYMEG